MSSILKWLAGVFILLCLILGFSLTWPMTASRVLYPLVEAIMIEDFVGVTAEQASAAFALIASGLSQKGYRTARDVMRLEGYLAELKNNHVEYGEKRYWLTFMGEPSPTEPWGWQLDGHHLVVNFFVLGDQVVMTPTFMGSEPTHAQQGKYVGTRVFDDELSAGLTLFNALTDAQQTQAILTREKTGNNNHGELFQDNAVVPYAGIRLAELDESQRATAIKLIQLYTDQVRPGHSDIKLTEILQHWDQTYFAWVGETGPDADFYYRIHSPVVMIEFDSHRASISTLTPIMHQLCRTV